MGIEFDETDPTQFCYHLEDAKDSWDAGERDPRNLEVSIFPLVDTSYDRGYGKPNFIWAPDSMRTYHGDVCEMYECAFEFTGSPYDLEKELQAIGLVPLELDY